MFDVIIIGAGPAGITAGLYAQRGNLRTLIIHYEESSLEKASKIDNYYGFKNGISGKELYDNGIIQAKNLGIDVKKEEVIRIEMQDKIFKVITTENSYVSKAIVIATGTKKAKPKFEGIERFEGKGVSYCAICDGFFYRNKSVAVIGSGNYAVSEVNDLLHVVNKITILTNGEKVPEIRDENVQINTKEIKEILGQERPEKIKFNDDTVLEIDGIFVANGIADSSDFARKLGIMLKNNKIVVNENMETNIKGIYACGDCIGGTLQIAKSVDDGMKVGLNVIKYLREM